MRRSSNECSPESLAWQTAEDVVEFSFEKWARDEYPFGIADDEINIFDDRTEEQRLRDTRKVGRYLAIGGPLFTSPLAAKAFIQQSNELGKRESSMRKVIENTVERQRQKYAHILRLLVVLEERNSSDRRRFLLREERNRKLLEEEEQVDRSAILQLLMTVEYGEMWSEAYVTLSGEIIEVETDARKAVVHEEIAARVALATAEHRHHSMSEALEKRNTVSRNSTRFSNFEADTSSDYGFSAPYANSLVNLSERRALLRLQQTIANATRASELRSENRYLQDYVSQKRMMFLSSKFSKAVKQREISRERRKFWKVERERSLNKIRGQARLCELVGRLAVADSKRPVNETGTPLYLRVMRSPSRNADLSETDVRQSCEFSSIPRGSRVNRELSGNENPPPQSAVHRKPPLASKSDAPPRLGSLGQTAPSTNPVRLIDTREFPRRIPTPSTASRPATRSAVRAPTPSTRAASAMQLDAPLLPREKKLIDAALRLHAELHKPVSAAVPTMDVSYSESEEALALHFLRTEPPSQIPEVETLRDVLQLNDLGVAALRSGDLKAADCHFQAADQKLSELDKEEDASQDAGDSVVADVAWLRYLLARVTLGNMACHARSSRALRKALGHLHSVMQLEEAHEGPSVTTLLNVCAVMTQIEEPEDALTYVRHAEQVLSDQCAEEMNRVLERKKLWETIGAGGEDDPIEVNLLHPSLFPTVIAALHNVALAQCICPLFGEKSGSRGTLPSEKLSCRTTFQSTLKLARTLLGEDHEMTIAVSKAAKSIDTALSVSASQSRPATVGM